MIPTRLGLAPGIPENPNPLSLTWHDSNWVPILNTSNVMDYFSERSNPFFDRTCNNEIVKMQRLNPDQLQNMTGLEYVLLHVQEPILYVIRKQHRHSPQQVTPLADYYIIAGTIYQAPDLLSVLNSRLISTVHHLQASFEEALSFARYHPSKGYSWDFKSQRAGIEKGRTKEEKPKEEPGSLFQRQRVDMLLGELIKKFPLPSPPQPKAPPSTVTVKTEPESGTPENSNSNNTNNANNSNSNNATNNSSSNNNSSNNNNVAAVNNKDIKTEVKQEKIKPPPEKKPKLG